MRTLASPCPLSCLCQFSIPFQACVPSPEKSRLFSLSVQGRNVYSEKYWFWWKTHTLSSSLPLHSQPCKTVSQSCLQCIFSSFLPIKDSVFWSISQTSLFCMEAKTGLLLSFYLSLHLLVYRMVYPILHSFWLWRWNWSKDSLPLFCWESKLIPKHANFVVAWKYILSFMKIVWFTVIWGTSGPGLMVAHQRGCPIFTVKTLFKVLCLMVWDPIDLWIAYYCSRCALSL